MNESILESVPQLEYYMVLELVYEWVDISVGKLVGT